MDRGVLTAMQTAVETFPDDEDLMTCCSRIIWAMSDACKDDLDANRIALLAAHGGAVCIAIVNRYAKACAFGLPSDSVFNLGRARCPVFLCASECLFC